MEEEYNLQEQAYIEQMAQELEALRAQQGNIAQQSTGYPIQEKQNLVEWQLDFTKELRELSHILKNDILVVDEKGERWIPNPNKEEVLFNEKGHNEIIKTVKSYLNKNLILSNYSPDEIKLRIRRFAHEFRALIYNNYLEYGLDTEYKISHMGMAVIAVIQMVESAYKRAMNGEERKDLNQARVVHQNEPITQVMGGGMYPDVQSNKKKRLWNPFTW